MRLQRNFALLCALLSFAVAVPAPVSPFGTAKWLLSQSRMLPLAAKSHLFPYNTRFRRRPVRNIIQSLRKRDVSPEPFVVALIHSRGAFGQAHNTVRRAHAIGPREHKMTRQDVAVFASRLVDHDSIKSKTSSRTKYPGLDTATLTSSFLRNTNKFNSKIGHSTRRKAAPMETSKDFAELDRTTLSIANRVGLSGEPCTNSSECADGRTCVNVGAATCRTGDPCVCAPSGGFESCSLSDDCSTIGEACVQISGFTVCLSEETASAADRPVVDGGSSDDPMETPASDDKDSDSSSSDGTTGAPCTSPSDCLDGRNCVDASMSTCPVNGKCICLPSGGPEPCLSNDDCSTIGEICVQVLEGNACLSEKVASEASVPPMDSESSDDPEESPTDDDTNPESGSRAGITGAACSFSSECLEGRICTNGDMTTCPAGDQCICLPSDGPERCSSSDDCSTVGEVCVQTPDSTVCLSEETANDAEIPIVDVESSGGPEETPANDDVSSDVGSGDGITGATCTSSSDCTEDRICTNGNMAMCPAGDSCICIPASGMLVCSSSADCLTEGEVCVPLLGMTLCISEEVANAEGFPILNGVIS